MTDEELDAALGLTPPGVEPARAARGPAYLLAIAALEADPYHERVAIFEFGAGVTCTIAARGLGAWAYWIETQRCCVPLIVQAMRNTH